MQGLDCISVPQDAIKTLIASVHRYTTPWIDFVFPPLNWFYFLTIECKRINRNSWSPRARHWSQFLISTCKTLIAVCKALEAVLNCYMQSIDSIFPFLSWHTTSSCLFLRSHANQYIHQLKMQAMTQCSNTSISRIWQPELQRSESILSCRRSRPRGCHLSPMTSIISLTSTSILSCLSALLIHASFNLNCIPPSWLKNTKASTMLTNLQPRLRSVSKRSYQDHLIKDSTIFVHLSHVHGEAGVIVQFKCEINTPEHACTKISMQKATTIGIIKYPKGNNNRHKQECLGDNNVH